MRSRWGRAACTPTRPDQRVSHPQTVAARVLGADAANQAPVAMAICHRAVTPCRRTLHQLTSNQMLTQLSLDRKVMTTRTSLQPAQAYPVSSTRSR